VLQGSADHHLACRHLCWALLEKGRGQSVVCVRAGAGDQAATLAQLGHHSGCLWRIALMLVAHYVCCYTSIRTASHVRTRLSARLHGQLAHTCKIMMIARSGIHPLLALSLLSRVCWCAAAAWMWRPLTSAMHAMRA
jgi:hypothetical protein